MIMEILWPIVKNFFPPKMLLEIYSLGPSVIPHLHLNLENILIRKTRN